ncbi:MAG: hypothetical protein N2485_00875 [bacterium]|nr:hypothetical protein [bacterium]
MTTGPINPNINDAVNKLFNQGAKNVASTFGAMSRKTQDQQQIEKQNYDISKEYQVFDHVQNSKELEENAKDSGLINQSLTNKELDTQEELALETEYPFIPSKEGSTTLEESSEQEGITSVSTGVSKSISTDEELFEELAKNVGVSSKEVKEAAYSEVMHNLETNKKEMTELKVTNDTNYIETKILKEEKPATNEIKEGKLIVANVEPIPVDQANELF